MICGAAIAGVSATQAFAETKAATEVTEIVVTGSRIAQPNITSNSPLVTVTQEDVKVAGTATIDTLTNALPQVIGGQNLGQSINSNGTATVDLRGLGPSRTVVLVNGRRLQPGDPQTPVADLNSIPAALVERVDVVTGGASAVYGADAVAGVVNFLMIKNFEGLKLDAQYSFNDHDQQDSTVQAALKAGKYTVPGHMTDGGQTAVSIVFGSNFDDDKGNVTVFGTYFNAQPVTQATRDYAACGLYSQPGPTSVNSAYDSYKCFGSSNGAYGKFRFLNAPGVAPPNTTSNFADNPNGSKTFVPSQGSFGYNFNTLSYLQRQDDRYTAGYFAHYQIAPKIELYSEFMFADDRSTAQYAPSGLFSGTGAVVGQSYFEVNCNNPLMSASQQTALCGAAAGTSAVGRMLAGYRFAAVPRTDSYSHTSYKINFGARGDLGDGWNYDVYAQYGTAAYQDTQGGYTSLSKIQKALLVDPTTGKCMSGGDCVPLNIFQALGQGISQDAYKYLLTPGLRNGNTIEQIVSGSITGDLGQYGVKSPWADQGLGVALGSEYRRESLQYNVDNEYTLGDLSGGSQSKSNAGAFDVYELFGEARMPIIQDKAWIKSLSVTGGYRYSDYNTGVQTNTYKGEAEYAPTEDVRFRYSYNRAVRAPNIVNLYEAQVQNLFNGQDPCGGNTPQKSLAACAASGVTAAQYGHIDPCPASQCGSVTGGNPDLQPELADTYTYGAVFTPHFIPGFSMSVDYWNIRVRNIIVRGLGGAATTLGNCLSTGSSVYCSHVHRDATTGDLFGSGFVDATNTNTGFIQTKGIDVTGTYRTSFADWNLPDWGGLTFGFVGTYTKNYVTQPVTGGGTYECAGMYGVTCDVPDPKWRHRAKLTWTTPWNVNATLTWRYIGSTKFDGNSTNAFLNQGITDTIDASLKAINYIDLSASYKVRTGLTLRGGVNNVFDQDPPRGDSVNTGAFGGGNGNTFPQTYDTLGRNIFMSVSAEF
ncbi:TonB-dependent receptor domain-containing protein [Phenylobacterium aquaticum]|uniref:TonB-dependent receptor domain-containing protein n=1 Tax=Phenylobacterium aquaticum TaxID=1763816 RepID=UPI0026F1197F|nr:TonB-dependent receptor [Phenylobacterium aquaticum]